MHKRKSINYLTSIIFHGTNLLVFAIPLVFLPPTYDIFDLPKSTLLHIGAILLFWCWAGKQLLSTQLELNHTKLDFPVLLFLTLATLSTFTSVHVPSSIFGTTGRYEGWLTLFSYALLFFVVAQTFSDEKRVSSLLNTMIVAATVVAVYGYMQFLGYDFFEWAGLFEQHRSFSTIGNPVLLAGYLVLLLPIALAAYLNSEKPFLNVAYGTSALIIFATIVTTFSRGGWVAAPVGIVAFALFAGRKKILSKKMGFLLVVGICTVLIVLILNQRMLSAFSEKGGISLVERISSIPKLREGSINTRLLIWRSTLMMMKERPLLGRGPETFWLTFHPFGSLQLARATYSAESPDNAHNYFLQLGSTLGIVGLFSFLAIIVSLFWYGWRLLRAKDTNRLLYASLLAGLVAYVAYLQSGVNVISSGTIFWTGMGLICAAPELSKPYKANPWKRRNFFGFTSFGLISIILLAAIVFSLKLFLADINFARAERTERSYENLPYIAKEYELAVRLNPYEAFYPSKAGIFYADQLAKTGDGLFFTKAASAFLQAESISPLDYCNYGLLGGLYLFAAENFNSMYYSAAEKELRRALELQPFWAASRFRLGVCYFDTGRLEKAIKEFELAEKIDPRIAETQLYLGRSYEKMGNKEEAIRAYRRTLELSPGNEEARDALARLAGKQ